jgi:hypothetical protein
MSHWRTQASIRREGEFGAVQKEQLLSFTNHTTATIGLDLLRSTSV